MCTAVTYQTNHFYFGRTLDYESSYGEEIVILPRKFPLPFLHMGTVTQHYAIIGIAHVANQYSLFYDAINEKGLCMAGLNFVGNAHYAKNTTGENEVAQYEFIPWILSTCATTAEAKERISSIRITDTPFCEQMPVGQLHWMIADKNQTITVEAVADGIKIYENPVGVLTNNPPFPEQLFRLNDFMHLSPKQPQNHFLSALSLQPYSRGMGALGLPGDLSSQSRFIRAALLNRKASVSFSTFSVQWNSNEAAVMLETDNMKSPSIRIATMRKREFSIIRPTRTIRFLRCICTMNHWTAISSFAIQ